jgi:multiple sugar transport system permease protein
VTFFNLVLGIIGALQVFTDAYVITNGGPNNATMFISVYLYRHAFIYLNFGYSAALAWVLFVIVMVLTLLVFR